MPVDCSELSRLVSEIALAHGARPEVKNLDDVAKEMSKDFPELTRKEIADAIVEAHTAGPRKINELSQKLTALKNEARRTSEIRIRQRLTKQIADLQAQLSAAQVEKKQQAEAVPLSGELEKLAFQRDRMRRQINDRINALKPKTIWQHISEPFNAARAIMTSMDLSAVFRQGGFIALGNPVRAAKAIMPMLQAFRSEQRAFAINEEIQNRPNAPLYARSKLYLSSIDGSLSAHEEAFMSRWVKKIPGVAGSERAYNTFLNKVRADSFDTMSATLAKNGEPTQVESNAIANFINVATGRGKLGMAEPAANFLNTVFFAPKYTASRFQLLLGEPMYGGTGRTRGLIAKEYGKYLIGMGVVYALGVAAGGQVEKDPRSSDFGKIKLGDTRLDPLSGLAQTTTVLSRLASGSTKTSTGQIENIRGNVPYGKRTSWDVATGFLHTKLSPLFGTAADMIGGKDATGQPVTPLQSLSRLGLPLSVGDIYKAIQDQGVPKGTALSLLNLMGMGLQTYPGPTELQRLNASDRAQRAGEPKGLPHIKNPRLEMLQQQERDRKSLKP